MLIRNDENIIAYRCYGYSVLINKIGKYYEWTVSWTGVSGRKYIEGGYVICGESIQQVKAIVADWLEEENLL